MVYSSKGKNAVTFELMRFCNRQNHCVYAILTGNVVNNYVIVLLAISRSIISSPSPDRLVAKPNRGRNVASTCEPFYFIHNFLVSRL